MSDHLVNPKDYDVDLHDAYASFMGYFERKSIPWWNHSHASYFASFGDFLAFGWGAIVVTDRRTGKGHVVVKAAGSGGAATAAASSGAGGGGVASDAPQAPHSGHFGTLQQFAKMVRTRFGESLPKLASQTKSRPLRYINDIASYKRLAATIPAAELHAKKKKCRAGDPDVVSELWKSRAYTFAALEVTWWEKGNGVVLEAGLCAVRCRNIDAMDAWPPIPDDNYRRSHYVVSDWLDKRTNTRHYMPSQPRSFAHGDSHLVSMSSLEKIISAQISSLASPDHDSTPNVLVLLAIGDMSRLGDLKNVHIPGNCLVIDVSNLERSLYQASLTPPSSNTPQSGHTHSGGSSGGSAANSTGHLNIPQYQQQQRQSSRPPMNRSHSLPLSLKGICNQLAIPMPPNVPITNSGNSAFYLLLAFQLLVDRDAKVPPILASQPIIHPGGGGGAGQHYPHLQIYPPTGRSSSRLNPNAANMHGPPSGAVPRHRTSQPSMRRAQTMFWDDAAASNLNLAGVASGGGYLPPSLPTHGGSDLQPHWSHPPQGATSGTISASMSRMSLGGEYAGLPRPSNGRSDSYGRAKTSDGLNGGRSRINQQRTGGP